MTLVLSIGVFNIVMTIVYLMNFIEEDQSLSWLEDFKELLVHAGKRIASTCKRQASKGSNHKYMGE